MTIRTVGELRAALADFPDYRTLVVEVTVGGDLVTDVVDLAQLDEVIVGSQGATAVRLVPVEDQYDTRELIDDGLLLRAMVEEGGQLGRLIADDDRYGPLS